MRIKIDLEITSSLQATPKAEKRHWLGTITRYIAFKLIATGAVHLVALLMDKLK